MLCPRCGRNNKENSRFCDACGYNLLLLSNAAKSETITEDIEPDFCEEPEISSEQYEDEPTDESATRNKEKTVEKAVKTVNRPSNDEDEDDNKTKYVYFKSADIPRKKHPVLISFFVLLLLGGIITGIVFFVQWKDDQDRYRNYIKNAKQDIECLDFRTAFYNLKYAYDINPEELEINLLYVEFYEKQGQYEQAIKFIEEAELKVKTTKDLLVLTERKKEIKSKSAPVSLYGTDYSRLWVGQVVTYGYYEQDNIKENGPEPIKWIIISKNGSSVTLISYYLLDCMEYNEDHNHVEWKESDLRKWLNTDFYDNAFTISEKNRLQTQVSYDVKNNIVEDIVTIPVKDDVMNSDLFSDKEDEADENRRCSLTTYAKVRSGRYYYTNYNTSVFTKDGDYPYTWWLSNSGYSSDSYSSQDTFTVGLSGLIKTWERSGYYFNNSVGYDEYEGYPVCGVRPKISVVFP